MNTTNTQERELARYLQEYKSIDPMTALRELGIMRLAARIHDLRAKGAMIDTRVVKGAGRKRWTEYRVRKGFPLFPYPGGMPGGTEYEKQITAKLDAMMEANHE